jgi:hypothetical protein
MAMRTVRCDAHSCPRGLRRGAGLVLFTAAALLATGCSTRQQAMDGPAAVPGPADIPAEAFSSAVATAEEQAVSRSALLLSSPDTMAATVTVPATGLPVGMDPDDVTATVTSFQHGDASGITFLLGPDGATFDEPVLLQWEGPWTPTSSISLVAHDGDGNLLPEPVTSVQVQPTSATTARFTLPVEHFSTWTVVIRAVDAYGLFGLQTTYERTPTVTVGTPATVAFGLVAETSGAVPIVHCDAGFVTAVDGPVEARFVVPGLPCAMAADGPPTQLTVTCSAAGSGTVEGIVYVMQGADFSTMSGDQFSSPRQEDVTAAMRGLVGQLVAADDGYRAPIMVAGSDHPIGVLFGVPFTVEATCVAPTGVPTSAPSTTTTAAPTSPTTARNATTTTSATLTRPVRPRPRPRPTVPSPTTSAPTSSPSTDTTRTTTSAATTGTVTATTRATTTTSAANGTTTTSPAAATPTTGATTTTTASTTTAPAPTTSTSAVPTPYSPGTWAFNEFGSCNWNGSGGCGWYHGDQPEEYRLGPVGSVGDRWPA